MGHEITGAPRLTDDELQARLARWVTGHGGRAVVDADTTTFVGMLLQDICSYCGTRRYRVDIDHITPPALGGGDTWENLTAACTPCNTRKRRHSTLWMVSNAGFWETERRVWEREARREIKAREMYPAQYARAEQLRLDMDAARRVYDELFSQWYEAERIWHALDQAVSA